MKTRKNVFAIIGSASTNSASEKLVEYLQKLSTQNLQFKICNDLKKLPHFDPDLSINNPPEEINLFRNEIENADAILICTPEYVFSIPSGLKNAIEWCVATTVFSDKPTGIIVASAHGKAGFDELKMIMNTIMAKVEDHTTLLISGIKGKINDVGVISDEKTKDELMKFALAFGKVVDNS